MPKVSRDSAPQRQDAGPVVDLRDELDGYTVSFTSLLEDIDATPLRRHCPQCICSAAQRPVLPHRDHRGLSTRRQRDPGAGVPGRCVLDAAPPVRPPPTDAPLAALIADSRTAPTHIDLLSLAEGDSSRSSDHLHEPRTEPRTPLILDDPDPDTPSASSVLNSTRLTARLTRSAFRGCDDEHPQAQLWVGV